MDPFRILLPCLLAAVALPPPSGGGKPLMEVLAQRQSAREFAAEPLTPQELADVLWAAAGVNRPDSGKRTAPTARNWQEIDVYALLPDGVYRYAHDEHRLEPVLEGDHRSLSGRQDFVATAPLNLLFVADTARMQGAPEDAIDLYIGADTAFMAENVYLYCASAGLACVVRATVDREAAHAALGLRPEQRVTLGMTLGHRPAAP